ncbi:MAG: hypothetical protein AAFP02_06995, partial [Bacteroidota bacterium]
DGNSFSFEVKDIKSLSVYHTGESTPFRKVYGLKITTHSGSLDFGKFSNNPVQRIDTLELSDSNYLTKVALQHISAAEKNTRSYTDSSLPTNIAYLKIETNQDDKIEAGKIRTNAFSAIVLSTADEVQTVSGRFSKIYGRYGSATKANNGQDDVYLKKISFDYTLGRFNPDEPQFRHSGRVHSFDKHFLETKIAKIALYQGDEFGLHTLVINENVYGSTSTEGKDKEEITFATDEHITHLYAECGTYGSSGSTYWISYLEIKTNKNQSVEAGTKDIRIGTGNDEYKVSDIIDAQGEIFAIGGWYGSGYIHELFVHSR